MAWGWLRAAWPCGWGGQAWKAQKGPLHSDVFRQLNTLQMHAPLDKRERFRLSSLQSANRSVGRGQEKHAKRVRQLLNVIVGVAVGTVAVFIRLGYQSISDWRTQVVLGILGQVDGWRSAALAAVVASLLTSVLALVASALVAWQPAAASSGIPGVIAYLNGVDLNHALGWRVLIAKIFGTILAVGSGLALGPEGPMIHIGAMVGRVAVHGLMRPALHFMGHRVAHLQDELERQPLRYDVQAAAMGAGAGIAAAFGAPLAGTVFVVEEAASFFSKRLFFHTFITCAAALGTVMGLDMLTNAKPHSFYARTECSGFQAWSWLLLLEIVLVSVLCGFLGWVFNRGVVAISKACAQQAYSLGQCWKLRRHRFVMVALIGMLCGASAVVFVASRPCADASLQRIFESSSGCIPQEWMYQITLGARTMPASQVNFDFNREPPGPNALAYIPAPGLFGAQFNPVLCPEALNRTGGQCRIPGIGKHIDPSGGLREEHYCCGFWDLDALDRGAVFSFKRPVAPLNMSKESWPRGACRQGHQDAENNVWIDHYSPAAALVFAKPGTVVRNLLVRGAPNVLPTGDVLVFLVGYGSLTVLSTGAWVPGGLLVPMMIIGAATGRLCGLVWDWSLQVWSAPMTRPPVPWIPELRPLMELIYPNAQDPTPGLPPEPGVLALAGCAAFLSGSGALALFVIVLLVEITLEPLLIPVVIIAVLAARGTASLLHSKGLYHELMEVQSLPFLNEHYHWRQAHYVVTDVLKEDVAVWQRRQMTTEASSVGAESPLGEAAMESPSQTQDWALYEAAAEVAYRDGIPDSRTTMHSQRSGEEDLERARELLVTVEADATREQVSQLLEEHPMVNGFPVVGEEGRLIGLATRASLEGLVTDRGGELRQQVAAGIAATSRSSAATPLSRAEQAQAASLPVGVEWAMDCAPFVVPASTHLKHAHMLFYQCGLRHLVVVDSYYRPVGLLTRKSLMPWRVPPVPDAESSGDTFVDSRNAHTPIHTPPTSPNVSRPTSRRVISSSLF